MHFPLWLWIDRKRGRKIPRAGGVRGCGGKVHDALNNGEKIGKGFSRPGLGLEKGIRVIGEQLRDGRFLDGGRGVEREFCEEVCR